MMFIKDKSQLIGVQHGVQNFYFNPTLFDITPVRAKQIMPILTVNAHYLLLPSKYL